MSLSSTTERNSYTGDGATSVYAYSFKVFLESELRVIVKSTASPPVETTLTITTDYTVSGVGETSGGNITLVNASQAWLTSGNLTSGYKILIRRVRSLTQTADIRNQGDFYPETHEDVFDKLVMNDQQQQDDVDRSVKLPQTIVSSDFDPTLPTDIATANATLVVNSAGDGLDMGPTTTQITNAEANATAAAASATLASQWASLTSGIVDSTDYSAKAWAIGGTGVTDTASRGAAKEWATETASTVDGTDYSAKEWAKGTQVRGIASGGSAKDWANYTSGTVDDTEFSAKKYANDAATSAAQAATSAAASLWNDVSFKTNADSPITIVDGDAGTMFAIDCTSGNVVVNLPSIAVLTLGGAWSVGFKKTDTSSNTITINPDGSETIDGASSKVISRAEAGCTLLPDADPTPDEWSSISFGEVPITGDIVGTTDTQEISAKTFTDAIKLKATGGGSNFMAFAAPATVTTSKTFILPDGDGASGQTLTTNGSQTLSWTTIGSTKTVTALTSASSPYTVLSTDQVLIADPTSGSITINLPAVASSSGRIIEVLRPEVASSNNVILDGNSSETINGATTYTLYRHSGPIILYCNGSAWYTVQSIKDVRMKANTTATTTIPTTEGDFLPATTVHDSHSAYSSATGFTAPFTGFYQSKIQYVTGAYATSSVLVGRIWVNGATVVSATTINPSVSANYTVEVLMLNHFVTAGQVIKGRFLTTAGTPALTGTATDNIFEVIGL